MLQVQTDPFQDTAVTMRSLKFLLSRAVSIHSLKFLLIRAVSIHSLNFLLSRAVSTQPEVSNPQTLRKRGGGGRELCLASTAGTKRFEVSNPQSLGMGGQGGRGEWGEGTLPGAVQITHSLKIPTSRSRRD